MRPGFLDEAEKKWRYKMKWKIRSVAAIAAVLICAGIAAAHEQEPREWTIKLEQACEGPGEAIIHVYDDQVRLVGWDLQEKTWYTLVNLVSKDRVYCLSTKKSTNEGKLKMCPELKECNRFKPVLVLTKDVDCDRGKIVGYKHCEYLFPEKNFG